MQKLTKEEAANYRPATGARNTRVRAQLNGLEVGEALIIEKGTDWKAKDSPFRIVNYLAKQTGRQFEKAYASHVQGWFVKRVK